MDLDGAVPDAWSGHEGVDTDLVKLIDLAVCDSMVGLVDQLLNATCEGHQQRLLGGVWQRPKGGHCSEILPLEVAWPLGEL